MFNSICFDESWCYLVDADIIVFVDDRRLSSKPILTLVSQYFFPSFSTTSLETSWKANNSTWLVEVAITICLADFHETYMGSIVYKYVTCLGFLGSFIYFKIWICIIYKVCYIKFSKVDSQVFCPSQIPHEMFHSIPMPCCRLLTMRC